MGIEQLDFLDTSADTMISLLDADKKDDAKALIQQLRGLITEEKRKVSGEGNTRYYYLCSGCSLACHADFKFIPADKYLSYCRFDGKDGAKFQQVDIKIEE